MKSTPGLRFSLTLRTVLVNHPPRRKGYTLEEYERMQAEKRSKKAGERKTHVSEEVRRKLSERLKERWRDPEYRERRSIGQRGTTRVPHSEETKARISEAVKERWKDPVYREKVRSRAVCGISCARNRLVCVCVFIHYSTSNCNIIRSIMDL